MRLPTPTRSPVSANHSRGFVLVSVLLIVALATVLVVASSIMAQIERRAAANSAKIDLARNNALFALDVALNQLQTAAGPDQRVTARAEILDASPDTPAVTGVTQPYWTGVWKTGSRSLDAGSNPQRQISLGSTSPSKSHIARMSTWFVSGVSQNASVSPLDFDAGTVGSSRSAVVLMTNYGQNSANVTVPLVESRENFGTPSERVNGPYGYWVSDEGVKAKVNETAPNLGKDSASDRQLHQIGPQATHPGKGILGPGNTSDFRSPTLSSQIAKTTTLQSLQFLDGAALNSLSGKAGNRFAADATTHSMGVLADVRLGGLKRDLTAAFEDEGRDATRNYGELNPDGTANVYRAGNGAYVSSPLPSAATSTTIDGLKWLSLYSYYNLYREVFPSVNMFSRPINPTGAAPVGVGDPEDSLPYSVSPRGIGWFDSQLGTQRTQISYGILAPTFLGYRWDVSLSARPASGSQYQLRIHYYFQIILHNPYSVTIRANLNNFRYGRAMASASNMYLQTEVETGASSGAFNTYYTAVNQGATLQRQIFATAFDDSAELAPGETRVFGLSADRNMNSAKEASEFRSTNAPFGFVSKDYSPTFRQTAPLQRITVRSFTGNPPSRSPQSDTYQTIPLVNAGARVRLRIVSDPTDAQVQDPTLPAATNSTYTLGASGSADISIPQALMWPTDGGTGGSTLQGIPSIQGSSGRRVFQAGVPGSNSTGAPNQPVIRSQFSSPVESLGERQILSMFSRKKGLIPTNSPNYSNSSIVVPYFTGNSAQFNLFYDTGSRYWDELFTAGNTDWPIYPPSTSEVQLDLAGPFTTTSWGRTSTGVDLPGERIVLTDIPMQPLVSIGQLMHTKPHYMFNTGGFVTLGFGSMFIGGSYASAEVPLGVTAEVSGTGTAATLVVDHSYLANEALFDSFFFSTVPPASQPSGTKWPELWTAFNQANSGPRVSDASLPLLNSRIKTRVRNGLMPLMADLRDMEKAAANLMLEGAFNINSTSEEAWVALLSSLSGNSFRFWNASSQSVASLDENTLRNPIIRFFAANTNGEVNTRWSGIRALDDAQVRQLARQIVSQVKMRGPFLSMSDFLNRRLGAASDLTRAGALQAAIDRTDLNNSIKVGHAVNLTTGMASAPPNTRPILANMRDASSSSGDPWDSATGIPGYLMQQDIVQCFSPVMTARSDTFVIRVYGEVRGRSNTPGDVEGRAWGEAVVQRFPDLVDASQAAESPIADINSNPVNASFGRRFNVVSFRWLNPNEI